MTDATSTAYLWPVIKNKDTLAWSLLLLLGLIWGSSYILAKKALIVLQPVQLASLRMGIAGMVLLPYAILLYKRIERWQWKYFLIVGLFGNFISNILFNVAQLKIASSTAGIINAIGPLSTIGVGVLFFKLKPSRQQLYGVLIGLAGVLFLLTAKPMKGGDTDPRFGILVVIATLFYSFSTNAVGRQLKGMSPLAISAMAWSLVLPFAAGWLFYTDAPTTITAHPKGFMALGITSFLALINTMVASVIYFKLIHLKGPVFASTTAYMMPVTAMLWGLADGEPVTLWHITGLGLILAGLILSQRRKAAETGSEN